MCYGDWAWFRFANLIGHGVTTKPAAAHLDMHKDLAFHQLLVGTTAILSASAQLDVRPALSDVLPAHVRVDSIHGVPLAERRVAAVD